MKLSTKFIYNEKGQKTGALIPVGEFEKLSEKLEDFYDYKVAKKYARGKKTEKVYSAEEVRNLGGQEMTFVNYLKGYKVGYSQNALKNLKSIEPRYVQKIEEKLQQLVLGMQNLDVKKLVDAKEDLYRLRVGIYRVIFKIYKDKVLIFVVSVDHRKEAYR